MNHNRKPSTASTLYSPQGAKFRRWMPLVTLGFLALATVASAQTGFATSEITTPIKNLVTIANATIAGLAVLTVIMYSIRWMGGDEGAAKKIILVIIAAVVALGAANFLGWVTGKGDFDAVAAVTQSQDLVRV